MLMPEVLGDLRENMIALIAPVIGVLYLAPTFNLQHGS